MSSFLMTVKAPLDLRGYRRNACQMMMLYSGHHLCLLTTVATVIVCTTVLIYSRNNTQNVINRLQMPQIKNKVPFVTTMNQPSDRRLTTPTEVNPIPTDDSLDGMTHGQLSDLFHGYVVSSQALCSRVLRMGKIGDGGWDVCDDPRYRPTPNNCLVYSFGIAYDYSYDDAIARWYGCEVHSYDPSMKNVKDHLRGEKVHFHRAGIEGKDYTNRKGWSLYTLGTLRTMNHHSPSQRRVDIVKMDVEGAELPSLLRALEDGSLKDVPQVSFETHMHVVNGDADRDTLIKYLKMLGRLWDAGFRLFHTNRNVVPVNTYVSKIHGLSRTKCHELHMVNINLTK